MSRYALILPREPVVQAFQSLVEPILNKVVTNIHSSRPYVVLRDALLPKLMSGEFSLRDAEETMEAVL